MDELPSLRQCAGVAPSLGVIIRQSGSHCTAGGGAVGRAQNSVAARAPKSCATTDRELRVMAHAVQRTRRRVGIASCARRVLDAAERPVGREPLTHGAPERGVQLRSSGPVEGSTSGAGERIVTCASVRECHMRDAPDQTVSP